MRLFNLFISAYFGPTPAIIYAAENYAGALLEVLVHANLSQLPNNYRPVHVTIPAELAVETINPDRVPGWDGEDNAASRAVS